MVSNERSPKIVRPSDLWRKNSMMRMPDSISKRIFKRVTDFLAISFLDRVMAQAIVKRLKIIVLAIKINEASLDWEKRIESAKM